jgi:predicted O-methyltransferase YrrM
MGKRAKRLRILFFFAWGASFALLALLPMEATARLVLLALDLQFGALAIALVSLHYKQRQLILSEASNAVTHVENLLGIYAALQPKAALPNSRGWAASPDFCRLLIQTIQQKKPRIVVELGSGLSTHLLGYLCRQFPEMRVYSVEQDAAYLEEVRASLIRHGIQSNIAFIHAPIAAIPVEGNALSWYDTSMFSALPAAVDCVIVDGPSFHAPITAANTRYPALPVFKARLAEGAIVLVDDTDRMPDREIVARWRRENPDLHYSRHDLEKGACTFEKKAAPRV